MAIELEATGRIVWGSPARSAPRLDQKTKQPLLKADGSPRVSWSFGLAIPKAEFQAKIWPALYQEAATVYQNPTGMRDFSWKYVDGDGTDREGKPYNTREGYAGHIVLAISTEAFAPPMWYVKNGRFEQLPPEGIKTGDFATVSFTAVVNVPKDRTHTPGLYINPVAVLFAGYGPEIQQRAADPNAVFGNAAARGLAPGASATPLAPTAATPMPTGGMPGNATAAPAPGFAGQPAAASPMPGGMPGQMPHGVPGAAPHAGMPPATGYPPTASTAYPSSPAPAPAHDFVQHAAGGQMPGAGGFPPMPGR